jgi:hypothetical protein
MRIAKQRLNRIENAIRFRLWLRETRMSEAMSMEEIEFLLTTGKWPERLEPIPGASQLDAIDRKTLLKRWEQQDQVCYGRGLPEIKYYDEHGHWPEQACDAQCDRLTIHPSFFVKSDGH